jgi:hypothetical protein
MRRPRASVICRSHTFLMYPFTSKMGIVSLAVLMERQNDSRYDEIGLP